MREKEKIIKKLKKEAKANTLIQRETKRERRKKK